MPSISPNSNNSIKTEQIPNKITVSDPSDLSHPTPDTVFAQFKQNTRNLIRRCKHQGVTVRELTREELPILKQITASTSERCHFKDQPLSYYEAMYDLFVPRGEAKFLLAELSTSHSASPNSIPNSSTSSAESSIPLSVAMFMLVGHEIVYLYSGSDAAFMKQYNAQYLIQWHMIKYALEHGYTRYNFYGLRALPTNPHSPGYGIYRFKKGFGGHVIELIGSFDLSINPVIYYLHFILSRLKSHLYRPLSRFNRSLRRKI